MMEALERVPPTGLLSSSIEAVYPLGKQADDVQGACNPAMAAAIDLGGRKPAEVESAITAQVNRAAGALFDDIELIRLDCAPIVFRANRSVDL
jgi:hypothetical protein